MSAFQNIINERHAITEVLMEADIRPVCEGRRRELGLHDIPERHGSATCWRQKELKQGLVAF